ncbi:30S ribosomal protein S9 [Candidatus Woesearchaeota archaeon]|nr:30S ribosomal protein S9 [Candidatus Woesearchaeota archaeon]
MRHVHVSGRRKQAIARASLSEGSGKVRVNKVLLQHFMPQVLRMRMMEPLLLAGDLAGKVDIDVVVEGGGISGQSDAARLAIARSLVEYSKGEKLKNTFLEYDRLLLVADVRRGEPSKPNDSKPRAKRQKSYR